jgi:hypothetical protein
MTNDTLNHNDNIVRIDNMITALNYLLEELETRKNQILQNVNIDDKIISHIEGDNFKNMMLNHINGDYGQKLNQEVAFMVFEKIDGSIQELINARVDARLREVGVNVPDTALN